ncbi:MAG: hypothetical protein RLZZ413_577 [Pseudomonadota bacterium]
MIKVFGHKSPDTDSTGSPIIWAWYLTEVKGTPAAPYLLGEPNTEAAFVLTHWDLPKPEFLADVTAADTVVIVDTNNPQELPPSINEANITGIIDHHMLVGGLKTRSPIDITVRPLACTATILHDLIGSDMARAPKAIKGAMLSCILSDTLQFRSPTTTPHDQAVAEKLAADLGISIPDYAAQLFAAKSDVSRFSDAELLRMDSKEYEVAGKQLRISVLETTAPKVLLDRKASLMQSMVGVAQERRGSGAAVRDRHPERGSHPSGAQRSGQGPCRSLLRGQGHGRHRGSARHHEPQETDHPLAEALIHRPGACRPDPAPKGRR